MSEQAKQEIKRLKGRAKTLLRTFFHQMPRHEYDEVKAALRKELKAQIKAVSQ